jgi:hypothetical protein
VVVTLCRLCTYTLCCRQTAGLAAKTYSPPAPEATDMRSDDLLVPNGSQTFASGAGSVQVQRELEIKHGNIVLDG